MPLVSMAEMLVDARRHGHAVCYCESWNLESFQAVIEAAEELHSPVIVGFNGGFLMHRGRSKPEDLSYYAGMGLALRHATVPTVFLLNETEDLGQIEQAIYLGFNAVMVESRQLSLHEYRDLVKRVVAIARSRNVTVEGQVGCLPDGWAGTTHCGQITDPEMARSFVEETGVDALAVSIGNVHILTRGKAPVDMVALQRIQAVVSVPLVIHGGTGFPAECAREVIDLGVAKFNFGTVLKQAYLTAIREKLNAYQEPMNPHLFAGMGGSQDILRAGREAVKWKVKELIHAYGFAGKGRQVPKPR